MSRPGRGLLLPCQALVLDLPSQYAQDNILSPLSFPMPKSQPKVQWMYVLSNSPVGHSPLLKHLSQTTGRESLVNMKWQHCPFTMLGLPQEGRSPALQQHSGVRTREGGPAGQLHCTWLSQPCWSPQHSSRKALAAIMHLCSSPAVSPGSGGPISLPVSTVPGPQQLLWIPYLPSHTDSKKAWTQTHGQGKEERW